MYTKSKWPDDQRPGPSSRIGQSAGISGKLQIAKPEFNEEQSSWQVYVPEDSNCLFLAAMLSYLIPANDYRDFNNRFDRLFGHTLGADEMRNLIQSYNPFLDAETCYDKIPKDLIQQFREKVVEYISNNRRNFELGDNPEDYLFNMKNPDAWGNSAEVKAISGILGCKVRLYNAGSCCDVYVSKYRKDKAHELELFRDVRVVEGGRDVNYYSFNLEKNIGDRYKQQADVDRQSYIFIKYFVQEFEAKLYAYNVVLEGEVIKEGKFSKTFSEKIGQVTGAAVGGVVGLFLGIPTTGAKSGAEVGGKVAKELGKEIDSKKQKEKVASLLDLMDFFQKDKAKFRHTLVKGGFDIFQSFEMQFIRVTTNLGPQDAMKRLAKDAVNRAIDYYVQVKDAFIAEAVMLGKSKIESLKSIPRQTPGFEVKYKYGSSIKEWMTASLYEKAGLVIQEETLKKVVTYYRKEGSKTTKYGYRRLLTSENWDKLKEKYTLDNNEKSESKQFAGYQYILDPQDSEKVRSILKRIDSNDKDLTEERIREILEEVKNDIIEKVNALKERSRGYTDDRRILERIERGLRNLKVDEYLKKFEQHFEEAKQERRKIVEEAKWERQKIVDEAKQERQRVADDNKKEHEKTQAKVEKIKEELPSKVAEEVAKRLEGKVFSKESVWFGVRKLVTSFTGRQEQLDQIVTGIQQEMIVIRGLAGVGKSELAIKYAWAHRKDYNNVVWVSAGTDEAAKGSFRRLLKELGLKTTDQDGDEKSTGSMAKEVYDYFANKTSLFIFDDAREYVVIKEFLPYSISNFHVLITSYNRKLFNEQEHGKVEKLDLLPLSKDKAVEFVKNALSINNMQQDKEIEELVETLGCLPLALQHAVAYIRESGYIEAIGKYIEIYKKSEQEVESFLKREGLSSYDKTIFATFKTTIDKIKQKSNGELAEEILNIIAYFASDNISKETFLKLVRDKIKESDVDIKNCIADGMLMRAINLLNQYSIVDL